MEEGKRRLKEKRVRREKAKRRGIKIQEQIQDRGRKKSKKGASGRVQIQKGNGKIKRIATKRNGKKKIKRANLITRSERKDIQKRGGNIYEETLAHHE